MIGWLPLVRKILPYVVIAVSVGVLLTYIYLQGYAHGEAMAQAECLRVQSERDRADAESARWWTAQIQRIEALRQAAEKRAAAAVAQTVTEYLPGKVEVRREIVERPVYRECVVSQRVYYILSAALAGDPARAAVSGT